MQAPQAGVFLFLINAVSGERCEKKEDARRVYFGVTT
jgi:hypothetical protein